MREPVSESRLANCIANTGLGSTISIVQTPDEPVQLPAWVINDRLLNTDLHHRKHKATMRSQEKFPDSALLVACPHCH